MRMLTSVLLAGLVSCAPAGRPSAVPASVNEPPAAELSHSASPERTQPGSNVEWLVADTPKTTVSGNTFIAPSEELAAKRKLLTMPADQAEAKNLAGNYANAALGKFAVVRHGTDTLLMGGGPTRTLTLRDAQHEYVFEEQSASPQFGKPSTTPRRLQAR